MKAGKIILVGFGPGSKEDMTYRARTAIAEADVVIGYSTYIKLVEDLLDGKEVVRKGMTEEIDRCVEAYEQAKLGKTVAVVSSGDIGIYGMAGPTYEVLLQSGWKPDGNIAVEVVVGSTALSACASLVGAPLTHDFCSISLSDLLTPWPVIAQRLEAAARADFVVALYNPKSGRRTQQIVEAQRIMLQYRKADTPVAIVKSAYRNRQAIQMVRLDHMAECDIGMLSTVLIGNSSTFMQEGLMITPRGYANKYESMTGETKEGERAGRSLTMGLIGWKSVVRHFMRGAKQMNVQEIARHFVVHEAEILSAIGEASADDAAGEFSAAQVQDVAKVLDAVRNWGALNVLVHSGVASSELRVQGSDLQSSGDFIKVETEHGKLQLSRSRVAHAWLLRQGEQSCGVYLLDQHGDTVCAILLARDGGKFAGAAEQQFSLAWNTLGNK